LSPSSFIYFLHLFICTHMPSAGLIFVFLYFCNFVFLYTTVIKTVRPDMFLTKNPRFPSIKIFFIVEKYKKVSAHCFDYGHLHTSKCTSCAHTLLCVCMYTYIHTHHKHKISYTNTLQIHVHTYTHKHARAHIQ